MPKSVPFWDRMAQGSCFFYSDMLHSIYDHKKYIWLDLIASLTTIQDDFSHRYTVFSKKCFFQVRCRFSHFFENLDFVEKWKCGKDLAGIFAFCSQFNTQKVRVPATRVYGIFLYIFIGFMK